MAPLARLSGVLALGGCFLGQAVLVSDLATQPYQDGGAPCTSGAECWWNGVCTNSTCVCYDAWTGSECNQLAEGESVQLWPNPSLPLLPDAELTDSWGSTVQRDDATGDWWMYVCVACVFSNGTPQPFSMHNSGIVAAKAPALEGPYEYAGPFTGIFSEGPHMTRGPGGDAAYLLITPGGNSSTPVTCTGAPHASARLRGPVRLGNDITKNVWSAPSPAGPWTPNNFSLNETGDLAYFSNPESQGEGRAVSANATETAGARRASPLTTRLARASWRGASTSFRPLARVRRSGLRAARASVDPTRHSPSRFCLASSGTRTLSCGATPSRPLPWATAAAAAAGRAFSPSSSTRRQGPRAWAGSLCLRTADARGASRPCLPTPSPLPWGVRDGTRRRSQRR